MVQFGRHLQFYLESEQVNDFFVRLCILKYFCSSSTSQFWYKLKQGLTSSHYIVPYIEIRDNRILNVLEAAQTSVVTIRSRFISEWRNALDKASEDFRVSTTAAWATIFRAISQIPQARGAQLETALRLYTPTVGITASQDMLGFLKGVHSAATLNVEALRKLVKKFDKKVTPIQYFDRSNKQAMNGHANGVVVDGFHNDNSIPLCEELLPELYSSVFAIGIATLQTCIDILRELLDDDYDDDHTNSDLT